MLNKSKLVSIEHAWRVEFICGGCGITETDYLYYGNLPEKVEVGCNNCDAVTTIETPEKLSDEYRLLH